MRKIATPTELQSELRRLLAYAQTERPSRIRIAKAMRNLSQRVGAGYVIGPRGLEESSGTGLTLQEGCMYALGASSRPELVVVTKVTNDKVGYKKFPFHGSERTMERWIAADLLNRGTTTYLKTYGAHMDPETKRSMQSLLRGGQGKKENLADWKPVTIHAVAAPDMVGEDLWYAAEEYGGVGARGDGAETVYEISSYGKDAERMKNDRRFKIEKIENRQIND